MGEETAVIMAAEASMIDEKTASPMALEMKRKYQVKPKSALGAGNLQGLPVFADEMKALLTHDSLGISSNEEAILGGASVRG